MSCTRFCHSLGLTVLVALIQNGSAPAQIIILHSFGGFGDGISPSGSLIQSGSVFYGSTSTGGTTGNGTVFRIGADGANYGLVHTFAGRPTDGASPSSSLVESGGTLYGVTPSGGAFGGGSGGGVVYKVRTDGTGHGLLHSFANGVNDGYNPYGPLTLSGSTLYGMSAFGGAPLLQPSWGTIYRINTDGTGFGLLHTFNQAETGVVGPIGNLVQSGSSFFGMTGNGSLFRIGTDGSGFTVLHSFANGASAFLTQSGSSLYGVGDNSLFRIGLDGSEFASLYSFGNSSSLAPLSLLQVGSTFYGMTRAGGANSMGSIIGISNDGTGFTVLHSFAGGPNDGASPVGGLILSGSTLYGMTQSGGDGFSGTVFSFPIVVPEPSSLVFVAAAVTGFGIRRRRLGATTSPIEPGRADILV